MAISTYMTALMKGTSVSDSSSYSKLIDIKDYPDLGSPPEGIDITTLSDASYKQIPGILGLDRLDIRCNYDLAEYTALKALEGSILHLAIWFGGYVRNGQFVPTGVNGKFPFDAYLVVTPNGGGVNEARDMTISLYADKEISFKAALTATLDKKTAVAADEPQITVTPVVTPSIGTMSYSYTWQKSSNEGSSWSNCGNTYTGYNTATITAKTSDNGKWFRCKVEGSRTGGGFEDIVYSDICELT